MEYSNSRNPYHDYTSKSIYLLTLCKSEGIMDFSTCVNDLGRRNAYLGVKASRVGEAIKNGKLPAKALAKNETFSSGSSRQSSPADWFCKRQEVQLAAPPSAENF